MGTISQKKYKVAFERHVNLVTIMPIVIAAIGEIPKTLHLRLHVLSLDKIIYTLFY